MARYQITIGDRLCAGTFPNVTAAREAARVKAREVGQHVQILSDGLVVGWERPDGRPQRASLSYVVRVPGERDRTVDADRAEVVAKRLAVARGVAASIVDPGSGQTIATVAP